LPLTLVSAAATERLGRGLADALLALWPDGAIIFLEGDLGAGKTTLVRGLLAGLGHDGRVPSPTYTLIEPYVVAGYPVFHVDLYRLRDPRELDDIGLAEQLGTGAIGLVEWPDHGVGHLPAADAVLRLAVVPAGREVTWEGLTARGQALLRALEAGLTDGQGHPAVTPHA
jgi:tRNA threonylcarbamoyladenosine biosynthesis protein TsaE